MDTEVTQVNETELLLDVLRDEEQSAAAALREVQAKKKAALKEQEEMQALEAELERKAYAEKLRTIPSELKVLGINYNRLRTIAAQHSTLRIIYVHRDIERLLSAALVSKSDEDFYQLVSALANHLVASYSNVKGTVHELQESLDTRKYFSTSSDAVSIPIAARAGVKSDLLSDLVTAWALEWGKATKYE